MSGFGALLSGFAGGVDQEWKERREDVKDQAARDFKEKLQAAAQANRIEAEGIRADNNQSSARLVNTLAAERDTVNHGRQEGLLEDQLNNAKELASHNDSLSDTYAPMGVDSQTGLMGQYGSDGKFHERGSTRRGGSVAANIQELQYLTQPKDKGGMGLSQDDAIKRVYDRAGKTIEERADAYARDMAKSAAAMGNAKDAQTMYTKSLDFYLTKYGGKKEDEEQGEGGNPNPGAYPDARQAPDGYWYVVRDGKNMRVGK